MSSLMESATSIERDLFNHDLEVRRLLLDFENNHKPCEVSRETTIELPIFFRNAKFIYIYNILINKAMQNHRDKNVHVMIKGRENK